MSADMTEDVFLQASEVRVDEIARRALLSARNSDGGWPYLKGRRSRLEPTCWALLALARAEAREPELDVLRKWPRQDGWFVDVQGVPPNHAFNALAALMLDRDASARALADGVAARIIGAKGLVVEQTPAMRQDNSLQAWSWVEGTFSWVEPTAWCLLLLKQRRARNADPSAAADRIKVAEQMLLDRVCKDGGWNYGNSNVYGKDLWPYVPTTAAALLAMQDRRDDASVRQSVAKLKEEVRGERSAVAVAISIICLRVFGEPVAELIDELSSYAQAAPGGGDINTVGLAMTLFAIRESTRRAVPFELG